MDILRITDEITSPKLSLRGVRDEAIPCGGHDACHNGIASSRTPRNDSGFGMIGKLFRLRS